MTKFGAKKGPLFELYHGSPPVIGTVDCKICGERRECRGDKSGWPYMYCVGSDGCGHVERTSGHVSARALIERVTFKDRHKRAKIFDAMNIDDLPATPSERADEFDPEPSDEPAPDLVPEPVTEPSDKPDPPPDPAQSIATAPDSTQPKPAQKKKGLSIKIFGKEINI